MLFLSVKLLCYMHIQPYTHTLGAWFTCSHVHLLPSPGVAFAPLPSFLPSLSQPLNSLIKPSLPVSASASRRWGWRGRGARGELQKGSCAETSWRSLDAAWANRICATCHCRGLAATPGHSTGREWRNICARHQDWQGQTETENFFFFKINLAALRYLVRKCTLINLSSLREWV